MEKTLLDKIIECIGSGDDEKLTQVVVDGLKRTKLPNDLHVDKNKSCLTTKLILGSNLYAMSERLKAKSKTGTDGKSNEDKELNKTIKSYLGGGLTQKSRAESQITGLIEYLESDDCIIEDSNAYKADLLKLLKDANIQTMVVEGKLSILAPIFTSLIRTKLNGKTAKDKLLEDEKAFEPLVIAIIDTKMSSLTMKNEALRDEVLLLASLLNEEKEFNNFLYDAHITHQMQQYSDKQEHWHTTLAQDDGKPMRYVAENGEAYTLFNPDKQKTTFFNDKESLIDLAQSIGSLDDEYNSNLYTLMRRLQYRITGKDVDDNGFLDTRYANPDALAQLYIETLLLAKTVGNELSDEVIFAICDPLVEILNPKNMKKLLATAKNDVLNICIDEAFGPDDDTLAMLFKGSAATDDMVAALGGAAIGAAGRDASGRFISDTPKATTEEEKEKIKQTQQLIIEGILGKIESLLGLKKKISKQKAKELDIQKVIFQAIKDEDFKGLKRIVRTEKEQISIAKTVIEYLNLSKSNFEQLTKEEIAEAVRQEMCQDILTEMNEINPRPNVIALINQKLKKLTLEKMNDDEKASTIKQIAQDVLEEVKDDTSTAKPSSKKPAPTSKRAKTKEEAINEDYEALKTKVDRIIAPPPPPPPPVLDTPLDNENSTTDATTEPVFDIIEDEPVFDVINNEDNENKKDESESE